MRFLVMTDIEGVTGVTTFEQAENSELGRQMLMHDLRAVLAGIRMLVHRQLFMICTPMGATWIFRSWMYR